MCLYLLLVCMLSGFETGPLLSASALFFFISIDCIYLCCLLLGPFVLFCSFFVCFFFISVRADTTPWLALQGENTVKVWGVALHGSVSLSWTVAEAARQAIATPRSNLYLFHI